MFIVNIFNESGKNVGVQGGWETEAEGKAWIAKARNHYPTTYTFRCSYVRFD